MLDKIRITQNREKRHQIPLRPNRRFLHIKAFVIIGHTGHLLTTSYPHYTGKAVITEVLYQFTLLIEIVRAFC